jgi:PAS domain S-box-containing protein
LTVCSRRANKFAKGSQDVIGRLTAFDLPKRMHRYAPTLVVQVAVGFLLATTALLLRAGADLIAPGVAPFVLLFPAILLATGVAGWQAGLVALAAGALFGWYFLLPPFEAWTLNERSGVSLGLYLVSAGLVIIAAAAYRRTALALRDSRERLDLATEAANVGVWEWRLDTGEMYYSDEAKRISGFPLDQPVTYRMAEIATHPDDRPFAAAQSARARDPSIREESPYEYRIVRPSGEVRWVYIRARAVFELGPDRRLRATRYVGTMQDITARKADEERLRLLAREVDHRANNLLAVVQGTVALSEADDPQALKAVITGRVNALARAHQLLAHARWEGADLRRLVEEELLAFSLGDEGRVAVNGAAVALAPAAAQAVAMALHELATNAAKYGALSTPEGRVEVDWRRDLDRSLHIRWRESGGPPVKAPLRKGLGTALLDRALSGAIRGRTMLDWRVEGLVCELVIPAAALELAQTREAGPAPAAPLTEPRAHPAR